MRITLQMKTDNSIYNINKSYAQVNKYNNELASGYRVTKPSDDPTAAYAALRYDLMVNQTNTYNNNINTGDLFLGQSDNALDSVNEVVGNAKAVVTGAANGTNTQAVLDGYVTQMRSYLQSLVTLANTTNAGQYLFGGTATDSAPYEIVDDYVLFQGNEQDIKLETNNNIFTTVNVSGSQAFGNLETTIDSAGLDRLLNLTPENATRLEDLNAADGVSGTTLTICWTAAFEGLNIDIASADTLYDVATLIEQASIKQAATYEVTDPRSNYVLDVRLNDARTGLEIVQCHTDGTYVDFTDPIDAANATPIVVRSTLAGEELGLISSSSVLNNGTTAGTSLLSGYALNPAVTSTTLLSDLANWDDSAYVIYNGDEPNLTVITDLEGSDSYCAEWNLTGLSKGENISTDGDLYYDVIVSASGTVSTVNVYNDPARTSGSLVATGTSENSLVILEAANNSGIAGSLRLAPPTADGTYGGELTITFDNPSTAAISVKAFETEGTVIAGYTGVTTDSLACGWELHGLQEGIVPLNTTGTGDNNLYVVTDCTGAPGTYTVNVYLDDTHTTLVATGTCGSATGTVSLSGLAGTPYEYINGQVDLSVPPGLTGTYDSTLRSTFKTVGDFTEAVNASDIHAQAVIGDGNRLEITSRLSGAYLRVSQDYNNAVVCGDDTQKLTQLKLQGVASGVNADANGNLFSKVEYITTGTAPVYTISVYSDNDRKNLVATGTSTSATGAVVINAVSDSGLTGSVYLDYTGTDDLDIEINAKGRSTLNDPLNQISQIDLIGLVEGITADYAGSVYATVDDDTAGLCTVRLYSDSAHTNLVATGTCATAASPTTVSIAEVGNSGVSGSVYLNFQQDDSDVVIIPGTTEMSGQEREENLFSLFTDAIKAMQSGDVAKLSELLEDFTANIDRLVNVRAQIGSTQNMLEMFTARNSVNLNTYKTIITAAVGTDVTTVTTQYASAKTTYEAALSVSAAAMNTNLFDYI